MSTLTTAAELEFPVWSTTAHLMITDSASLSLAEETLRSLLRDVDAACSRFRADSELSMIAPGRAEPVSPLLLDLVGTARRVARATDGLVDPTVAAAVIRLGYDSDIDFVRQVSETTPMRASATPAPGVGVLEIGEETLLVPAGVGVDLGATAKAWTADTAASLIAEQSGCGVLVGIGGDIAVAGQTPPGGWRIGVGDDHRTARQMPAQVVSLRRGGLATSSTTSRRWRRGLMTAHHIVDPRTGLNPASRWRTVSTAAGSCVDANAAATAAIILGDAAPTWLEGLGIPSRLVSDDGVVVIAGAWPLDDVAPSTEVA